MKNIKIKFIAMVLFSLMIICNIASHNLVTNMNEKDIAAMYKDITFLLGGDSVGIKLLAEGVLVMKVEREDVDLKVGDVILQVNSAKINTSEALENIAKASNGNEIELKINRNGLEKNVKVLPKLDSLSSEYKLNIWVKDSSAGVGTITFYDLNNLQFAGLGHGVTETEENYIVPIQTGAITLTDIYSIKKGYANDPGEVRGTVTNEIYGSIVKNTKNGIYGKITDKDYLKNKEEIFIATKEEIKEGTAQIYTSVNYGKKEYYDIKIEKVMINSEGNKNMLIKVTDQRLLELTGGIIQGMSGSPIIQDGKLIGAVTHVLLNDPTTGYGVFIENMLKDMNDMK